MTTRKFKFRQKTIQMPWTPECRDWFGLAPDEESPAFYSVRIQLSEVTFICRVKGKSGWRNERYLRSANFLNLSLLAGRGS